MSVHNSRYNTGTIQYVADAYITAPFATADNTDDGGSFTLVFVGMEAGTTVQVQAEKAGLEVVNTHDLERVVIGRKDPLPIYLAEEGLLARAQTELYNISKQALYAQRDDLIARLRSEGEQRAQAMRELRERLGREVASRFQAEDLLNQRIEILEKKLPSFAQELAAQNLDFASDLYISAYECYREGDIAGAVALLDSTALEHSYQDALRIKKQEGALRMVVGDLRQRRLSLLRQTIDSYALKAEGLALSFRYGEVARQYERIVAIYRENGLNALELAEWYDRLGETYNDDGRYPEALDAHQRALSLRDRSLGPKHLDLATSYNNIALVYQYGKFKKALEYHQRALAIREEVLNPKHPDLAASYNNIAWVCRSLGEYQRALGYHQRAIAIQEEVLGPKHPDLATSYNNIAWVYRSLGECAKALEYQQGAIAIQEEVLGPKHPDLAFSYNNIASVYHSLGEYQKALEYHQRAIGIQEEVLGLEHPYLAFSYNYIALLYHSLGQYQKALDYQLRTIDIAEATVDAKNPYLATCYANVASTYGSLGAYWKALEYHQRAVVIREEVLGAKHPELAVSYDNIALVYHSLGAYWKALEYHREAIVIQEQVLGSKHPDLARSYNSLGNTYRAMEEHGKALGHLERALSIRKEVLPKDHPDLATSHHDMGMCLYGMERYRVSVGHLQRALTIRQEALPESHPDLVASYGHLGLAYAKGRQWELARLTFETYEALSPDKVGAHRNWVLYHALKGDDEKALASLQRAVELGYDDLRWIEQEGALEELRDMDAYKELIERLKVESEE